MDEDGRANSFLGGAGGVAFVHGDSEEGVFSGAFDIESEPASRGDD